jgi:hypothetical protein
MSQEEKPMENSKELPFSVGDKILIRTVTVYHVGQVKTIGDDFVVLTDASWVADTGRFAEALADGTLNEVECVSFLPWVFVGRAAIIDAFPWNHNLPAESK